MSKKNYNIVTSPEEGALIYHVYIQPHNDDLDEQSREFLHLFERIREAFTDILMATEADLTLSKLSNRDTPDRSSVSPQHDTDRLKTTTVNISGQPLTPEIVRQEGEELLGNDTEDVLPKVIRVTPDQCCIYLNQGDVTIDQESKYHKLTKYNEITGSADRVPLSSIELTKRQKPSTWSDTNIRYQESIQSVSDNIFIFDISITSDIWTEQTSIDPVHKICQVNRARFFEAYSKIKEEFDVLGVNFSHLEYNVAWNDKQAKDLFRYDGPPAEEVLTEYRIDWVNEHLREQATGHESTGHRIVDFGTVDEEVFPQELKARIETYVEQTDSSTTVDRVRVVNFDGQQLEGILTDSGIDWNV